jgi:hypothetical protein
MFPPAALQQGNSGDMVPMTNQRSVPVRVLMKRSSVSASQPEAANPVSVT